MDGGGRWGLSGVEEGRRSVRVVIEAEIDVLLASMESWIWFRIPCPYVDDVLISHSYSNESCMVLLVSVADLVEDQDGRQGFLLRLHLVSI